MLAGYHGRYVRVDAATGTLSSEALAPEILRRFVGGVGLETWILAVETEPGSDPLAEQSTLVFALSSLVGTPLTTSAKFALVAISPLTGRICDALFSSHFALAAKRAGVDAIVITGRRGEPSIVFIEGNTDGSLRVIWQPAAPLWRLPARQAEEHIRARHGADWQVAAIGPAGERLIPFATISHDGRHAGRGGRRNPGFQAHQGRRRPRAGRECALPTPRERSPWPGECRPCLLGRQPKSTGSWARWRSVSSMPANASISARAGLPAKTPCRLVS